MKLRRIPKDLTVGSRTPFDDEWEAVLRQWLAAEHVESETEWECRIDEMRRCAVNPEERPLS